MFIDENSSTVSLFIETFERFLSLFLKAVDAKNK